MRFFLFGLLPPLLLVVAPPQVQARDHPSTTSRGSEDSAARNGCCSRNYRDCSLTETTKDAVVGAEVGIAASWYCDVPRHCGRVAGCLGLVWLSGNVFDAGCVGHRRGPCTATSSERACCTVSTVSATTTSGEEQLVCDSDDTETCLLPSEIQAHRHVVHTVVPEKDLRTPGWDDDNNGVSTSTAMITGCCSHNHKTCDTTGYCNWKERCGVVDPNDADVATTTTATTTVQFKDDHCKDYIWLTADWVGEPHIIGDGNNNNKSQDCAARQADTCATDDDCCPGLYCHKVVEREEGIDENDNALLVGGGGGSGYNHCSWSIDKLSTSTRRRGRRQQ